MFFFSFFFIVQGIGDSVQGFANFVLYCYSTETVRRRMINGILCRNKVRPTVSEKESSSRSSVIRASKQVKNGTVFPSTSSTVLNNSDGHNSDKTSACRNSKGSRLYAPANDISETINEEMSLPPNDIKTTQSIPENDISEKCNKENTATNSVPANEVPDLGTNEPDKSSVTRFEAETNCSIEANVQSESCSVDINNALTSNCNKLTFSSETSDQSELRGSLTCHIPESQISNV